MSDITADDLFNYLSLKFPPREYALLAQVRNCTGFSRQVRTADAILMSLWPSRGLELAGIEIKIDRRDWLREKDDPEKQEAIGKYCDRWWIVTPPGVVQPDELPLAWGLLEWHEDKTKWKTIKASAGLAAKPLTRDFLASILRNVSESNVPLAAIEERVQKGIAEAQKTLTRHLESAQEEVRMLKQRILEFEKASGVSLGTSSWTYHEPQEIGRAVHQVLNGDHARIVERLNQLKTAAELIVADITRHLVPLEERPSDHLPL